MRKAITGLEEILKDPEINVFTFFIAKIWFNQSA